MASYDSVASLYDEHWGQEFAAVAREAFDAQLLPLLPRRGAVLDLCCGTGLMLAHMDSLGLAASGVDESAGMLDVARRNAPRARLQQADMAAFVWDTRFDAVVWFYNSLNHASSLEHVGATLVNVARHLRTGGCFLFDYVVPQAFETGWNWNEKIEQESGVLTLHYCYEPATCQATCWINRRERIHQISVQPREIRDALSAARLSVVREAPMAGTVPRGGRQLVLARKQ